MTRDMLYINSELSHIDSGAFLGITKMPQVGFMPILAHQWAAR